MIEVEDLNILDELRSTKTKKSFKEVLNQRAVSSDDMDELFLDWKWQEKEDQRQTQLFSLI